MNEWTLILACALFLAVIVYDHVSGRKGRRTILLTTAFIGLLGFGLFLRLDFDKQFNFDESVKFSIALIIGAALMLYWPKPVEDPWVCFGITWLLILLPWTQGNLRSVNILGLQFQVLPLAIIPFCIFLSRAVHARACLILALPIIAVIAWRDLGSSLIYMSMLVLASVFTLKGNAAKAVSVVLGLILLASLTALHSNLISKETVGSLGGSVLAKYQLKRFTDFNRGGSEEVQKTRVTIVSSGLTGYSDSDYENSRRVAEVKRDLTIAIVAERTGLLGMLAMYAFVLTVFFVGMLVARAISSVDSPQPYADRAVQDAALTALICSRPLVEMLLAVGTSTHMFLQTGIPLPFFSDAPASLISHMMGFALLQQLSEHERTIQGNRGGSVFRHRLIAVQFLILASLAGTIIWLGGIYLDTDVATSTRNRRLAAQVNPETVGKVLDAEGRALTRMTVTGVRPLAAEDLLGFLNTKTAQGQGLIDLYRSRLLAGDGKFEAAQELFLTKKFPAGADVKTTLDLKYQKTCDQILQGYRGGFVGIMDSRDGHILCASGKGSSKYFNHLLHGEYEPGSIFKLLGLIAIAELHGSNLSSRRYDCVGHLELTSKYAVTDRGHGVVDYSSATAQSCNTFYVSESWPVRKRINELVGQLGVTSRLRFQRFSVESGIYEEEPTRSVAGMQHLGIGPVRVSPLHLLRLGAAIIEGGEMPTPTLILNDPDNPATSQKQKLFNPSIAPLVREATVAVVENGTGRAARIEGRRIGGKTGTVGGNSDTAGFLGFDFDRHLVAVVLLKTKGHGGEMAAPEVRKLLLLAQ